MPMIPNIWISMNIVHVYMLFGWLFAMSCANARYWSNVVVFTNITYFLISMFDADEAFRLEMERFEVIYDTFVHNEFNILCCSSSDDNMDEHNLANYVHMTK